MMINLPTITRCPAILPQSRADATFLRLRRERAARPANSQAARCFTRIIAIFEERWPMCAAPEFGETTTLGELFFDDVDRSNLALLLEDEFGITLPNGVETKWRTVGDAVQCVRRVAMGRVSE